MRCPKCGYNSFDHLDNCKKCGKDLLEFKQQFGIKSVLFPGRIKPEGEAPVEAAAGEAAGEAAEQISVAAASAAAPATAEDFDLSEASAKDDFGFDFMGESEEEEDLSFDELFEEAPADEDVEETLPEPEQQGETESAEDDFSFDVKTQTADTETFAEEDELAEDFGFDPSAEVDDSVGEESDFSDADSVLPTEEQGFDFDEDSFDSEDADDETEGTQEDPKDPFDQPGPSHFEAVPEPVGNYSTAAAAADAAVEAPEFLADVAEGIAPELVIDEEMTPEPATNYSVAASVAPPAVETLEFPTDSVEEIIPESVAEAEIIPEPISNYYTARSAEASTVEEPELFADAAEEMTSEPAVEDETTPEPVSNYYAAAAAVESVVESVETTEPLPSESAPTADVVSDLLPPIGSRVLAFVCDLLLLVLVGTSFILAAEAAMFGGVEDLLPSLEILVDLSIPYFLVIFFLCFGYFTLFHFLAGQTPGKMLAGLRVETLDGESLIFSQAFLRSVGGLLQALPVGLGYLAILSSADRRGWNDRLAGTRLVNLKALPEEV